MYAELCEKRPHFMDEQPSPPRSIRGIGHILLLRRKQKMTGNVANVGFHARMQQSYSPQSRERATASRRKSSTPCFSSSSRCLLNDTGLSRIAARSRRSNTRAGRWCEQHRRFPYASVATQACTRSARVSCVLP